MARKLKIMENTCGFDNVKPIMVDYPYPETKVKAQNQMYANLLSNDYCGTTSEMSAITQYINNENRLSCAKCPIAKSILGIAMAEMIHLQKLGQLIFLLGGDVSFVAVQQSGRQKMWTPSCLDIPDKLENMPLSRPLYPPAAYSPVYPVYPEIGRAHV